MYEPETILKLKVPRTVGTPPVGTPSVGKKGEKGYVPASEDYQPASEDFKPFPYDRVRVIGQSPINHGSVGAGWEGTEAQGVIVTPLEGFGSTLDEPYGKLRELYEVESLPSNEVVLEVPVRVVNSTSGSAGATPEEVFKEKASVPDQPHRRRRVKESPLGETVKPADPSPIPVEVPPAE